MKIEKEKFVSLSYELIVDGEMADKATSEKPLEFIYEAGFLLPEFEKNIAGLSAGDDFKFTLNAANGYGEIIPDAIIELPKSVFMVEGEIDNDMLTVGNSIPMMDNQGNRMVGKVIENAEDSVKMDFNHPLAGKTLNFSGKVEGVRETTDVDRAKFMGLGGGCGCGEGDCGSDCECDSKDSCGCN